MENDDMLEERKRKEVEVECGERRHMENNTKGDMEEKKKKDVKKTKRERERCKRKR